MPTYNIRNKSTGKTKVVKMSISEMTQMLADNPDLDVVPGLVGKVEPRLGSTYMKPSEGFKDVLRDIKRRNPGSTIDV